MGQIKTLLHLHTDYSRDARTPPEAVARFVEREGFGCVAVTDHDTIRGALHLRSITYVPVIVGSEISTRDGDLIGLFLDRDVPAGMSARETALAIRRQGGLVLVPHPFIRFLGCGLGNAIWDIIDMVDAIEVFNAQNVLSMPDRRAAEFARRMSIPGFVGSDSHVETSIAPCYQVMPDFECPAGFLRSLSAASFHTARHPLSYFAGAAWRTVRQVVGAGFPRDYGAHHGAAKETVRVPAEVRAPGV